MIQARKFIEVLGHEWQGKDREMVQDAVIAVCLEKSYGWALRRMMRERLEEDRKFDLELSMRLCKEMIEYRRIEDRENVKEMIVAALIYCELEWLGELATAADVMSMWMQAVEASKQMDL